MGIREYLHNDDYEFLLKSQNGRCAICHTPIEDLPQNSLMLEYGISRATAYNWKNNAGV